MFSQILLVILAASVFSLSSAQNNAFIHPPPDSATNTPAPIYCLGSVQTVSYTTNLDSVDLLMFSPTNDEAYDRIFDHRIGGSGSWAWTVSVTSPLNLSGPSSFYMSMFHTNDTRPTFDSHQFVIEDCSSEASVSAPPTVSTVTQIQTVQRTVHPTATSAPASSVSSMTSSVSAGAQTTAGSGTAMDVGGAETTVIMTPTSMPTSAATTSRSAGDVILPYSSGGLLAAALGAMTTLTFCLL